MGINKSGKSFIVLMILLIIGILPASGSVSARTYEVWQCGANGEFNLQGYDDTPYIQFYPFRHKIGDLYKFDLFYDIVVAINVSSDMSGIGNVYGYILRKEIGSPVMWFEYNNGQYNDGILFDSCSYSAN